MRNLFNIILISVTLFASGCAVEKFPGDEFVEMNFVHWTDENFELVDAREFIDPTFNPTGETDPARIAAIISARIIYTPDHPRDNFQYPRTTWEIRTGDCEDQAVLLCSAFIAEGYNAWAVVGDSWLNSATADHAWVVIHEANMLKHYDATSGKLMQTFQLEGICWWQNWQKIFYAWNNMKIYMLPGEHR